jgi:hypothetical protein
MLISLSSGVYWIAGMSPSSVSWIVGMFELGEILLISSSSGVSWIVGSFKQGGVLIESQRHTWLETGIAWHPSNGQIDSFSWQANWHHYLPWSV